MRKNLISLNKLNKIIIIFILLLFCFVGVSSVKAEDSVPPKLVQTNCFLYELRWKQPATITDSAWLVFDDGITKKQYPAGAVEKYGDGERWVFALYDNWRWGTRYIERNTRYTVTGYITDYFTGNFIWAGNSLEVYCAEVFFPMVKNGEELPPETRP